MKLYNSYNFIYLSMNKLIILLILYFLYKIGFIVKLFNAIIPFILGLGLSYMFYPLEKLLNKKTPKVFSITIIVLLILLFIVFIINIIIPSIIKDGPNLINTIFIYLYNLSIKYNINIDIIISKLSNINYSHIINGISISVSFISNIVIIFISFIYFLYYMDSIKNKLSNLKIYNYLKYINNDLTKYISSLAKISIISFFEYIIAFKIIGYPKPLLIGLLASILNMIPYIGGVITVFITIIIVPSMIVKISILYIILGLIEGYIITPYVYGKYNKINPLIGLISLSIGSILGFLGMVLSFPILIIILSTINYIKENNIKISILK